MAKKKKRKTRKTAARKTNPPKRPRRRKTATGRRNGYRPRRRNNGSGGGGVMAVVLGVAAGTIAAGGTDYALAGMTTTATPGRRAIAHAVLGLAQIGTGLAVGGGVGDGLVASGACFMGMAGGNGARALAVAIQGAKTADKADTQTSKTMQPNADGMKAIVPAVGRGNAAPGQLQPGRRVGLQGLVMDQKQNRLSGIVVGKS